MKTPEKLTHNSEWVEVAPGRWQTTVAEIVCVIDGQIGAQFDKRVDDTQWDTLHSTDVDECVHWLRDLLRERMGMIRFALDEERPKPNASELDVIFRIRRRIEDILTAPAFSGRKSERRITVNAKEAEVIRKHIGDTIHPDALKVSTAGFVCSLAGVWVLERLEEEL